MEMILAPSMLSADFSHLDHDLGAAMIPEVHWLHVDVMDGRFVRNISFGPPVIACVRRILPDSFLDVHMMVEEPGRYIEDFKNCGADMLTIHQEATTELVKTIIKIKDAGVRAGVAINPETSVSKIESILHMVDMVLIMSVNPGFGGQDLISDTLNKVKQVVKIREERGLTFDVEIDGGVKLDNVEAVMESGANVIVVGSAIFKGNISSNTTEFIKRIQSKTRY